MGATIHKEEPNSGLVPRLRRPLQRSINIWTSEPVDGGWRSRPIYNPVPPEPSREAAIAILSQRDHDSISKVPTDVSGRAIKVTKPRLQSSGPRADKPRTVENGLEGGRNQMEIAQASKLLLLEDEVTGTVNDTSKKVPGFGESGNPKAPQKSNQVKLSKSFRISKPSTTVGPFGQSKLCQPIAAMFKKTPKEKMSEWIEDSFGTMDGDQDGQQ